VKAQITTSSGARLVGAAGTVCTVDAREQYSSFFASHPVPSSEKALERAKNRIDDCIDFRAAQEPNLKVWLEKNQ